MSLVAKLKSFGRSLGVGNATSSDPKTQAYIDFNRRKWSARRGDESKGVVLVGLFSWNPSIHCYSYVANHLAAQHGAAIRTFYFQKNKVPGTAAVFASFGAEPGLTHADATDEDRTLAEQQAGEIFLGLKSKWDVIHIAVDGVPLGDLIYDTYLRYLARPTVILDDPELRAIILDTLLIYHACRRYLATHNVRAVIPDHTVYSQCGVLLRLAAIHGIPTYLVYYSPRFLVRRLDYRLQHGEHAIQSRWPYYDYRKIFSQLPPDAQARARERGGAALRERLTGTIDATILTTFSPYDAHAGEHLMESTGRPRILVLLHDFCDAVHLYRRMLFPDFVEWSDYLLEHAAKTPFDWYLKPHPNILLPSRAAMTATNQRCVAELQEKFPFVRVLDPKVSNRQLVDEGIASMFTVHGTAAHEFAAMGVPVVNAGDNPHAAYPFNIHAQTLDEYAGLIARADQLHCDIQQSDVAEQFYMYYQYFYEHDGTDAHPIDPALLPIREIDKQGGSSDVLDICKRSATPEREAALASYLDETFAR